MCAPKRNSEQRIVNVDPLASSTDLQGKTVVPVVGDEKCVRIVAAFSGDDGKTLVPSAFLPMNMYQCVQ